MKNPLSKNGAPIRRNGSARARPKWFAHLNAYPNKKRLVFESDRELEKAIDLLWTDELRDLPHDTPDGRSLVIPAEAVICFTRAGLKFSSKDLKSINDLSPEQIAALRR
jgi:hypothetical protein